MKLKITSLVTAAVLAAGSIAVPAFADETVKSNADSGHSVYFGMDNFASKGALKRTYIKGKTVLSASKAIPVEDESGIESYEVLLSEYFSGADTADSSNDYIFWANDTEYDYEITAVSGENTLSVTDNGDGSYTISKDQIIGNITITAEKIEKNSNIKDETYIDDGDADTDQVITAASDDGEINVELNEYLSLGDGKIMYLILVDGEPESGNAFAYDSDTMYFTKAYSQNGQYAFLKISDEKLTKKDVEACIVETMSETQEISCAGDVNLTGSTDINDAQLVYNMYNAVYSDFKTVSMEKFLAADQNKDKKISIEDSAAIISVIKQK